MTDALSSTVLAWLLTYLIHSTVLLGLAWAFTRARSWSPVVLDVVWKTALVGGLVTATAQLVLEVRPAGSLSLERATASATPAEGTVVPAAGTDVPPAPLDVTQPSEQSTHATGTAPSAVLASPPRPLVTRPSLHTAGMLAWGLVGLALALGYAARRLILVGRIGDRHAVIDGQLLAELDLLTHDARLRRRPRLTATDRISSPIALGLAEICVPESALTDLDLEQQRSMLAHELAHLARRDPLWLGFASLVERVLWIQPLNRIARREIATSAEYLCDEWAVRRTGSGVALARCLAQVAEWIQTSPLGVPVAGMAEERSLLVSRVEKLLAARGTAPRSRRTLIVAAGTVMLATIAMAPSVTGRAARANDAKGTTPSASSSDSSVELTTAYQSSDSDADLATHGSDNSEPSARSAPGSSPLGGVTARSRSDADAAITGVNGTQTRSARDSVVVVALIARLRDENADVRRAAANALGKLEDARAVPALISALRDRSSEVRAAAAGALGNFHDPRALDGLSALLADDDRDVRKHALEALAEYESGVPVDGVIRLLQDSDAELRHAAAHALGKWKERRAGTALAALVRDPSAEVRAAAIESLTELRDASHASAIISALADQDAEVRHEALEALEELKSPIPQATLLNLMGDRNADVRAKAAEIAGERSVIGAIPTLRRMIDDADEDVRESAVQALSEMADDSAADALRAALNSKDAKVRRAATEALGDRRQ